MKGWIISEPGGLDVMQWTDLPEADPEANEVQVQVRAVSVNGVDIHVRKGEIPDVAYPIVPGVDIAGEVLSTGSRVHDWKVGERVSIYPLLDLSRVMGEHYDGGFREKLCVNAEQLIKIPNSLTFEIAASLPATYATAFRMLVTRARVTRNESVVVIGAAGGLGTAVVQIGIMLGARVVACSRSRKKLEEIAAPGLVGTIDLSSGQLEDNVRGIFGGLADVCVNFVGGPTWEASLRCVRPQGRVLVVGAMKGHNPPAELHRIFGRELTAIGSNLWEKSDQEEVLELARTRQIRPKIDILPFSALPVAHSRMEGSEVVGKIVLVNE